MEGSEFCYPHNPEVNAETKQEARAKGGRANKAAVTDPTPAMSLHAHQSVVLLLEDTINCIRSSEMDLKAANCLGYLAGQLSKAMEVAELEDRMTEIEKLLDKE